MLYNFSRLYKFLPRQNILRTMIPLLMNRGRSMGRNRHEIYISMMNFHTTAISFTDDLTAWSDAMKMKKNEGD